MTSLFNQLEQLTQGLLFISESEYPIEPFTLASGASAETETEFLKTIGATGQTIETVTLSYFFRNMVRTYPEQDASEMVIAQKFIALQQWMEKNLQEVRVYRVGQIQVQAYALGKAPDQTWLGVKTTLIET